MSEHSAEIELYGPEWVELELRREWWLNHGHDSSALYGDDGELQCSLCHCDFKRTPIAELRTTVFQARLFGSLLYRPEAVEAAIVAHDAELNR